MYILCKVLLYMVATGQEIVREKRNSSRSGKSQGISLWVRENLHLWKKSGESEILRVLIYLLPSQWCFCMVKNVSCQSILFPCYVKELSIHVHCVCLAESINKRVERMAVRGGWRPLSGLICEIVNSVGQGNFTFVREKSGKSQGISNTYGCGNHVCKVDCGRSWRNIWRILRLIISQKLSYMGGS